MVSRTVSRIRGFRIYEPGIDPTSSAVVRYLDVSPLPLSCLHSSEPVSQLLPQNIIPVSLFISIEIVKTI